MLSADKVSYRVLAVDDEDQILESYRLVLTNGILQPELSLELSDLENELFADPDERSTDQEIQFALDTRTTGDDGFAAVAQSVLDGNPYHTVFIDVRMPPGMNGIKAAELIRKIDPNIRIVVVTGYSDVTEEEIKRRIKPSDGIYFVQKPFQSDDIRYLAQNDI